MCFHVPNCIILIAYYLAQITKSKNVPHYSPLPAWEPWDSCLYASQTLRQISSTRTHETDWNKILLTTNFIIKTRNDNSLKHPVVVGVHREGDDEGEVAHDEDEPEEVEAEAAAAAAAAKRFDLRSGTGLVVVADAFVSSSFSGH